MRLVGVFQPEKKDAVSTVIDRLSILVDRRYKCKLDVKTVEQLTSQEVDFYSSYEANVIDVSEPSRAVFPILIQQGLAGVAEILDAEHLSGQDWTTLRDLIAMVLESVFMSSRQSEVLGALERQLASPEDSNVVDYSRLKKRQREGQTEHRFDKDFSGKNTLQISFLIESNNFDDMQKMAVEIHEKSKRFAFLHFDQIDKDARNSSEKIKALGPVTLFISDIAKLSDKEIFAVVEYLKYRRGYDGPQFVSGTLRPTSELLNFGIVPSELVRLLSAAQLRMTKSFSEYVNDGIVPYLFKNLPLSSHLTTPVISPLELR